MKRNMLAVILATVIVMMMGAGNSFSAVVRTPMEEDLDAAGYDIFSVGKLNTGDIVTKGPWVDVRAFGAVGDGITDDSLAFNNAIAALPTGGGTVIVPSTTSGYILGSTVSLNKCGVRLVGLGSGAIFTKPALIWGGAAGGTMIRVEIGAHGCAVENFVLDGNDTADYCLHVRVDSNLASTHRPYIANITFQNYARYGLVLGNSDDTVLGSGQHQSVTCYNLAFRGGVQGASGILVNAQNAEFVNFYTLYIDPRPGREHTRHIFIRSGAVNIFGLVSTRATDYAIKSYTQLGIYGWRSEDGLLLSMIPSDSGGPITLTGIVQRGEASVGGTSVIYIGTIGQPVVATGLTLRGNFVIGPTDKRYLQLGNIRFVHDGDGVIYQGPTQNQYVMYQDVYNSTFLIKGDTPTISFRGVGSNWGGTQGYKNAAGKISNIVSLSATSTEAQNLRGSVTFASASTASVTFPTAEPDAAYFVAISGDANENFWVTDKTALGFTINSDAPDSTATVDWILIR